MNQHRYDALAIKFASAIHKKWKDDFGNGRLKSRYFSQYDSQLIEFDIEAEIDFDTDVMVIDGASNSGGYVDSDEFEEGVEYEPPYIGINIEIPKDWLPQDWDYIYGELVDIIRHEMEHLTQHGVNINDESNIDLELDNLSRNLISGGHLPNESYFLLPSEIMANLQGMRLKAEVMKKDLLHVFVSYLQNVGLNDKQIDKIINKWREYADSNMVDFPKF